MTRRNYPVCMDRCFPIWQRLAMKAVCSMQLSGSAASCPNAHRRFEYALWGFAWHVALSVLGASWKVCVGDRMTLSQLLYSFLLHRARHCSNRIGVACVPGSWLWLAVAVSQLLSELDNLTHIFPPSRSWFPAAGNMCWYDLSLNSDVSFGFV